MRPLKIEFSFGTPVVRPDTPLHLDALLAWARVEQARLDGTLTDWGVGHDIPVERHPLGFFKASIIDFERSSDVALISMVRVSDPAILANAQVRVAKGTKNLINTSAGTFKKYRMNYRAHCVERATAWCIGDPDGVRNLLGRHVTNIGKLGRVGCGKVTTIEVTECDDGAENWRARNLPLGSGLELPGWLYAEACDCLSPPYWNRLDAVMVSSPYMPASSAGGAE